MNNFLEKFTLYDWIGYMIPGTVTVLAAVGCIYKAGILEILSNDIIREYKLIFALGILAAGYLAGIIIAQIGDSVYNVCTDHYKKFQKGAGYEDIGYGSIKKALIRAGIMEESEEIRTNADVDKYMGYIYGYIQVHPQYARLHNYASMELICKNMSIAVLVCCIMWILSCILELVYSLFTVPGAYTLFLLAVDSIHIMSALAAAVLSYWAFYSRVRLFYQRKSFYAVTWFVQEYLNTGDVGRGSC